MPASKVLQTPPASPHAALAYFSGLLAFETDPADVYADMRSATGPEDLGFVLVDVRSAEAYAREHAAGAVHIPHAELTAERLAAYPAGTVFVVYCWSPGCNGAAKAAHRLAGLGRPVKLLQGGIEYWKREGNPMQGAGCGVG